MEDRWSWWRTLLLAAVMATFLDIYVKAYQEPYSISQISPNSASNLDPNLFVQETASLMSSALDDIIDAKPSTKLDISSDSVDPHVEHPPHVVVVRSAAPILHDRKSKTYDDITSSNKIEEPFESNDVEVHHKPRYYNQIQPTKTQHQAASTDRHISSSIMTSGKKIVESGEAKGVPRGRALSPKGPQTPIATTQTSATSLRYDSQGRQNNPDIQDIITGIVKLLNGNVNVQANTQPGSGRPVRPSNTRINNRGPPRISDVPPLPPDFDTPGPAGPVQLVPPPPLPPQPSTKMPPPYPFDRPPTHEQTPIRPFLNGIPIPEQIVPINNQNYRPTTFVNGRPPGLPPWQRPRPRPPTPNRRPNPNLPMYKPQPAALPEPPPSYDGMEESFTTIPKMDEPGNNEHETIDQYPNVDELSTIQNEDVDLTTAANETFTQKPIGLFTDGDSFVPARDPPSTSTTENPLITVSNKNDNAELQITTVSEPEIQNIPTKQEVLKEMDNIDKKKQTMIKAEKEKPGNNNKKQDEKQKESEQLLKNSVHLNEDDAIKNNNSTPTITSTPVLESSMIEHKDVPQKDIIKSVSIMATPTEGLPGTLNTAGSTSSTININSSATATINTQPSLHPQPNLPYHPYKPRPGIVLDDTEYRPVGGQPVNGVRRPVPPQRLPVSYGEIFDVTVSAIQGPNGGSGSATVQIESVNPLTGHSGDIIVSASGDQGFVSIDGKRTYLNLFGDATPTATVNPTPVQKTTVAVTGTGYAVPEIEAAPRPVRPQPPRLTSNPPGPPRRPHQPPVRIDTCIVGDDSTCDQTQNERCKTEAGISSCHCRPGYAKRNHRDPCRKVVAMVLSLRADRMYDRKLTWDEKLNDKESELFQQLSYETVKAIDSAFSMTPYSDEFVSGTVNKIYKGELAKNAAGVYINVTILLEESGETLRGGVGSDITRHLLGVIQRRSNNVGSSALWVDRPAGSISRLQDLDECSSPDLNDCHEIATCTNIWGSFKCECPGEARDTWAEQPNRAGRQCHMCPASHCSNRGSCSYRGGQPVCTCTGSYYGSQCEVDGEVVGVAVGASLAALVVILLTLACLVMWSRRWSREQKTAAGMGSPVFGYMAGGVKTPNMGQPPYQVTLEERMRWAQLADVMAQANHYAQPEPIPGHPGARPQSAMYGAYPTLPMAGSLPPVPMPRMGLHMGSSTLHLNSSSNLIGNCSNTIASRANTITGLGHTFNGLSGFSPNHGTESTSSESDSHAQDRTDLLGSRSFHVPRPKSRSNATNSIANQSGIYYDVDYENAPDPIYGTKGIPLSTYTMNRNQAFYRQ